MEPIQIENSLELRQKRLLELEGAITRELNAARFELKTAADEVRQLRHEAANYNLTVYTEAEAAEILKIGEGTLRRLRTDSKVSWPCFRPGDLVRYTNLHLIMITEILGNRVQQREATKKKTHLRGVDARAS
jgi:hypothetical protein